MSLGRTKPRSCGIKISGPSSPTIEGLPTGGIPPSAKVANGVCDTVYSNEIDITVDPFSEGGTVTTENGGNFISICVQNANLYRILVIVQTHKHLVTRYARHRLLALQKGKLKINF